MAALASLSGLLFLQVSEAVSITPAGFGSDSVVLFITTEVGCHREARRPLYEWGRSWVRFLRCYAEASCIPEGQPLVRGGVEAVERIFADLLRDSPYSGHRWHSLRRGGAAAAFHRSPNVAYFVWWGRWKRLATALEYALGYSDPAVVGALVLPWPVGGQASDERLAVVLAALWGDPMYASPERKSTKATMEISVPVPAGPVVSLPDLDVATNRKEVDDVGFDSDSSSVPSESSDSDVSTASARNITIGPSPSACPGERPQQFTPGSRPQVVGSGRRKLRLKGARKAPRGGAAEVDGADKPRPKRRVVGLGGPLSVQRHHATSAQVGLGSAKARRPASKRRHPDGPPVGPASKVAVRSPPECKGKGGGTEAGRGGGGSRGNSPPAGVTRETPSACDTSVGGPVLSSAQGSLRVITLADGGPCPLTRADFLYVRLEPVPLFVHFLQAFFSFLPWLHRALSCGVLLLMRRLHLFVLRFFITCEDFRLRSAPDIIFSALSEFTAESWQALLHLSTSPVPQVGKVDPQLVERGLGAVGSYTISDDLWCELAPPDFRSI